MSRRNYSADELRSLRYVERNVWHSGDPAERGPAQYATGTFWPDDLRAQARDMEDLAHHFRLAANAMEREIEREDATQQPRRCGACRDLSDTHVDGCDGTWGQ